MKLGKDKLAELESLVSCFFSRAEIAIVLDINAMWLDDQLADDQSEPYRAYQRGKLKSKLELNKTIITQAKQGSGPAQSLAKRLLDDLEATEL